MTSCFRPSITCIRLDYELINLLQEHLQHQLHDGHAYYPRLQGRTSTKMSSKRMLKNSLPVVSPPMMGQLCKTTSSTSTSGVWSVNWMAWSVPWVHSFLRWKPQNALGIALFLSCIGVWRLWRLCVACDSGSLCEMAVVVRVA